MSKMLGQDIVTQEEFDIFLDTQFKELETQFVDFKQKAEEEKDALNKEIASSRVLSMIGMASGLISIIGLALVVIL